MMDDKLNANEMSRGFGCQAIANHCHDSAALLLAGLRRLGCTPLTDQFFDTISVRPPSGVTVDQVIVAGHANGVNMRKLNSSTITLACDETTSAADLEMVW